jgi:hypothetical protein
MPSVSGTTWNDDVRNSLVSLASSKITVVTASGTNVILESGYAILTQEASGAIVRLSGTRVVVQSGAPVKIDSGLNVIVASGIPVSLDSGLSVVINSGIRVILQSGTPVKVDSGLSISLASGLPVHLDSGLNVNIGSGVGISFSPGATITATPKTFSSVSANMFAVGTSASQLPNVSGLRHILRLAQSGIVYLAPISTVTSGVGFIMAGDPSGVGAEIDTNIGNLNFLYGVAVTSTPMTHISFAG